MILEEILQLPVGTTLQKGKRKRILLGFRGYMILYKTKTSSKKVTGVIISDFLKWAKDAEVVTDSNL